MPRQARVSVANVVYYAINRANSRQTIFNTDKEYRHFESLVQEAEDNGQCGQWGQPPFLALLVPVCSLNLPRF